MINFSVYSQSIPTAKQFLNFLKENNYTCNSIDYEEVYSNYEYDVEDDVSQLIDAIDSFFSTSNFGFNFIFFEF